MEKRLQISMFEVVGSSFCVALGDGQKVYKRLSAAIAQDQPVSLSFKNVSLLTAAFLNVAVGQLYGNFDENQIRQLLKAVDIEPDDKALLRRVVDSAKRYFKDPQRYEQALKEELG